MTKIYSLVTVFSLKRSWQKNSIDDRTLECGTVDSGILQWKVGYDFIFGVLRVYVYIKLG